MTKQRSGITVQLDRWSYLWLAVAAILGLFASGKWLIPLATWLSPVFMLRFVRTQKPLRGFILGALVSAATMFFAWQAMVPIPPIGHFFFALVTGLTSMLLYLADRLIAPRLKGFAATLVLPLACTTWEYVNSLTSPYGSWGSMAYTQAGNLPLIQLVSVTGIWGVTFLIYWFASVVNWAWEQQFEWQRIRIGVGLYASLLTLVLLFGGARLAFFPPSGYTVRVAAIIEPDHQQSLAALSSLSAPERIISGELTDSERESIRGGLASIHDDLFALSEREARAGARIVFWPEGSGMVLQEDEAALIERGRQLARQEGIYLGMAMGVLSRDPGQRHENKVVLIDPSGEVVWEYFKHHLVVGPESPYFVQGEGGILTLDTPYGRIATVICHDMDHIGYLHQAGRAGVDLMFVPTGDWREAAREHLNMAILRAVEQGFILVRPTRGGISAAVDYQGRVLASMDEAEFDLQGRLVVPMEESTMEDNVMIAHVPVQGVTTVYSRIGDASAWLCIAGFVAILGWAVVRGITARRKAAGLA